MAAGAPESVTETTEAVPNGTRREILDAAANCFMARGYANTSIDDVARSLGSTKGRIYHHYASKSDLFADVFKTGMDLNYEAVMPEHSKPGTAAQRLVRMALAHTRNLIVTKPYQRAVWEGVELHLRGATTPEQRATLSGLLEYRSKYGEMFRFLLAEGGDVGEFVFDNLSIANQAMLTALNSPVFWYSQRPGDSDEHVDMLTHQVVTFAMRGLGYKGEISQ